MPIVPEPIDPVQEESLKRKRQKEQALAKLASLAAQGVALRRRLFFVPGWSGEEGQAWKGYGKSLLKGHASVKEWIDKLVRNRDQVTYVSYLSFSPKESANAKSFLDFAEILKAKVRAKAKPDEPIDVIGHSMGGLDIVAAITQGRDALTNVQNCVTVASPFRGIAYSKFVKDVDRLLPWLHWEPYHHTQVRHMDHQAKAIRMINEVKNRVKLLERVRAFYQLEGTQDMTVMRNARLRTDGLPEGLKKKITQLIVEGAAHSGASGITHDPRTLLYLISIIADLPLEKPKLNYGYLYVRKSQ